MVLILTLVIGSLLWFPVHALISNLMSRVTIPIDMTGGWIDFINAIRNWYLLFFILIPLILWVLVQSQKPKGIIVE